MAGHESLAERYSVVLEELRLEAVKQTETTRVAQNQALRMNSVSQAGQIFSSAVINGFESNQHGNGDGTSDFDLATNLYANGSEHAPGEGQNSTTPSSLMAELTSWGEFDSLVSARPISPLSVWAFLTIVFCRLMLEWVAWISSHWVTRMECGTQLWTALSQVMLEYKKYFTVSVERPCM